MTSGGATSGGQEEAWQETTRGTRARDLHGIMSLTARAVDPLTFWIEQENMYPLLATLAVEVLTIPASSTPVERVFSTAGESSGGNETKQIVQQTFRARGATS